jgi:branched-chain amino acid transport system substrate-binding protein
MGHERREVLRARKWLALGIATLALGVVAAGCGDDDSSDSGSSSSSSSSDSSGGGGPIKIAYLSDCEGAFGAFYEPDIAGANVAFIKYAGAKAAGSKPSDGLEGAKIGDTEIEFVGTGCADDTADKAIEETRRLMEQEDADILIGPLSGDEGIAVANYAKEHPDKTFVNGTSGAQDTTLKVQAPNFFRFHSDGAQWSAGLGDYAYNELGWKKAAIIGDDYSFPYTSLAGFAAEFCAVGGQITKRIWPPLGEKDYSSFISQIPDDVDGIYYGIGGAGLVSFMKQYQEQKGKIDPKKTMGNVFFDDPLVLKEVSNAVTGAYTAGPTAADSNDPKVAEYVKDLDDAYGKEISGLAASVFVYNYYTAAWALIQGLEQVNGDISDQTKLQEALKGVTLDAPWGEIKLDEYQNGVADNYVKEIVPDTSGDKVPDVKTIRKVPGVEQTFGGTFTPDTPAPDRTNPKCEKGNQPDWVGNAEEVDFSSK